MFIITATLVMILLIAFVIFILFAYKKNQLACLQEIETVKLDYDKNLLQTQLEIQEQTFQDIAREIHDNIGLSLSLAKLRLNTINYTDASKTNENIESSIELISKAIGDLSDISKNLHSEAIKKQGLYNSLKAEAGRINRSGRHQVEFTGVGNVFLLDANKELVLYRIAQEALNNIICKCYRHMHKTCV